MKSIITFYYGWRPNAKCQMHDFSRNIDFPIRLLSVYVFNEEEFMDNALTRMISWRFNGVQSSIL